MALHLEGPLPGARVERGQVWQAGSAWAYIAYAGEAQMVANLGEIIASGVAVNASSAWAAVRRELRADRARALKR